MVRCSKPTIANGNAVNSRCVNGLHRADIVCDEGYKVSTGEGMKIIECDRTTEPPSWIDIEDCAGKDD